MLRIKRAVQASYNTEASFVAAQAAAASKGTSKPTEVAAQEAKDAADPMAAMERSMNAGTGKAAPAFVASTLGKTNAAPAEVDVEVEEGDGEGGVVNGAVNPDAIQVDEDEF